MSFSIAEFARTNKVILIWTAFAALLYLFRDMFGLVFITYIMCFITHGLTHRLHRTTRLRRRFMVAVIYSLFTILVTVFLFILVPRVISEAKNFTDQLPQTLHTIENWVDLQLADSENLAPLSERIKDALTVEQMLTKAGHMGLAALERSGRYASWFFLGLLFSFLIMLDLPHLTRSVRALRFTRLASVYEETADSVILFAKVVGENFRAQMMISAVNTVLTAIGLKFLGVEQTVLLCTLVFFCGLIPVLGVFISSVPIVLMSFNAGGVGLRPWAGGVTVRVHFI